ncbi:uncharacterized protein JCM6883_001599 [Sporobolomyces salmoneus]|uniref:uncharacterized protein n=1 Tax=Sporobolomyces salmoneus TaxID=183962 RepID=UPI003172C547
MTSSASSTRASTSNELTSDPPLRRSGDSAEPPVESTNSIRTSDSTRLPPLLRLPSELLLDILDLTLPVEQNRLTMPIRNETLRQIALTHPVLTSWAQTRLFRESAIYTDRAVDKLMDLTDSTAISKGARAGELARTILKLSVFGPNLGSPLSLARLVQQLPHLCDLQLNDLDGLEMRAFLLGDHLNSFEARRCGFRSRFRLANNARASHVTSFSLVNCTAHDDAFSGFSLPNLRSLTLRDISLPPPSPLATLEHSEAFKIHAHEVIPRLRSLTVDEYNFLLHFPLPRRAISTTLEYIHLYKLAHLSYLIDQLPSSLALKTIQLTPPNSFLPDSASVEKADVHFESLLAPFRSYQPALARLTQVILDEKYLIWLETGEKRVGELLEICEKRGIEMKFVESPPELERGGRRRTGTTAIMLARERRTQSLGERDIRRSISTLAV